MTQPELDWFYGGGTAAYFPEAWQCFIEAIPADERQDLITAYYKRLTSDDADTQLQAALQWTQWEMATCRLKTQPMGTNAPGPLFALALARIESHFFIHNVVPHILREVRMYQKARVQLLLHAKCRHKHTCTQQFIVMQNAFSTSI